jgi:hypothetical protein
MHGRVILVLVMLWSGGAFAAGVVDATGRTVDVPDHVVRVAPAVSGRDPMTLAALSNAVVYGHTLTPAELDAVLAGVRVHH